MKNLRSSIKHFFAMAMVLLLFFTLMPAAAFGENDENGENGENGEPPDTVTITVSVAAYYLGSARVFAAPGHADAVVGNNSFRVGATLWVEAIPRLGFAFAGWFLDDELWNFSPNAQIVNISEDMALEARFVPVTLIRHQVYISTRVSPAGGGVISGGGWYMQGETVAITAHAQSGWRFDGWFGELGNLYSRNNRLVFTADRNRILSAQFSEIPEPARPNFNIQTNVNASPYPVHGGMVTGGGWYDLGEMATVTASPLPGWIFAGWYDGGVIPASDSATFSFAVDMTRVLVARFVSAEDADMPGAFQPRATGVFAPPARIYLLGPAALDSVSDTASAVIAVQNALALANDPFVVERGLIELFADNAIARAAAIHVDGGNINVNRTALMPLEITAIDTRTAIEHMFSRAGYIPQRRLRVGASFISRYADVNVNFATSAGLTDIETVRIITPFYYLYFPAGFMEQNVAHSPLTVSAQAGESVRVSFSRRVGDPIRLGLPPFLGETRFQTMRDYRGNIIPSAFNIVTGKIDGRVRESSVLSVAENPTSFWDISGLSLETQEAINVLAAQDIVSGTGDGAFNPFESVTRAQMAAMTMQMLGRLDASADGGFTDVARSDWFFGAAGSASRHGIMRGTGWGFFSPYMNLPRYQFMVISARILRYEMGMGVLPNPDEYLRVFQDRAALPGWSLEEIALATKRGLILVRANGNLSPHDPMTRADAAVMLHRLYLQLW
ncbi:MAG: S-layer homology domain-containing protein [Defluviitaleaceae bacterium]|nr:S-layer homology domain-containing protein [Defluviitaleaceae bacterium]